MARRAGGDIRTKIYQKFRGVDFATDPALVDDTRSPWAPNIYADMGGMPCKRPGWKTVKEIGETVESVFHGEKINGLFRVKIDGDEHMLVHAGTKLYRWSEDGTEPGILDQIYPPVQEAQETEEEQADQATQEEPEDELSNERSTAVYLKGALWIFAGNKLLVFDKRGEEAAPSAKDAADVAYIPTVQIGMNQNGSGGSMYETINLLTQKRKASYKPTSATLQYYLPEEPGSDDPSDFTVEVEGAAEGTYKVETVYKAQKYVMLNNPPPQATGNEDTVKITYVAGKDNSEKIKKCSVAIAWGVGGTEDRIVASGNPDYPNQDWISGFGDGAYWPDLNYSVVGSAETAIVGSRRFGEQLAIFKEDNGQDSTVFLRSGSLLDSGEAVFTVKPCVAGAGGASRFGFGNIGNEQLILTQRGVYALTNNVLTAEKIMQNRSFRVDPKLIEEPLSEAVCCSWDGCYLVFVNGHVYGMDGRQQRSYPSRNDTEFIYECFYWDNVPARCVLRVVEGDTETLYFGTEDGRICKFKTADKTLARYSDEDGEEKSAITAIWSTPQDDDGDPMILKTLLKKGNAVTLKPYNRSSAEILFRTDKDAVAWHGAEGTMDIFDWEDIDFARFTFNSNDAAQEIPLNRKVKNYKRLQILVKNDAVNEGFGVFAITKHFVSGNFAKR